MSDNTEWDTEFTWHIENFSACFYNSGDKLESPAFKEKSLNDCKWCLWIYPAGICSEFKSYISCFLSNIRNGKTNKNCAIKFQINILNANYENLRSKTEENRIFKSDAVWGWNAFIEIDRVTDRLKNCSENTLVVRCLIKNKEKNLVKKEVRTRINSEKHFLEWNIQVLSDGIFTSGNHFFCLEDNLYRIGLSDEENDLDINISKVTESTSSCRPISGKISLSNAEGKEAFSKSETYDFERENKIWKFPSLIPKKQLQDNIAEYLIDGNIIFLCEFSVCKRRKTLVSNINCETVSNIENLMNLSNGFRSLLLNKSNTDVKLQTSDEVEVSAHRSILAARSPVFSVMFDQEMLENQTGIVKIEDVDSNTLKHFLKFLYTGVVDCLDCNLATKLLVVADKYQVPNLKKMCASVLSSTLTLVNVCGILVLADMVHHQVLKAASLDFAAKHAVEIFSSPNSSEWIKEYPQLSAEILAYPGKKSCN